MDCGINLHQEFRTQQWCVYEAKYSSALSTLENHECQMVLATLQSSSQV